MLFAACDTYDTVKPLCTVTKLIYIAAENSKAYMVCSHHWVSWENKEKLHNACNTHMLHSLWDTTAVSHQSLSLPTASPLPSNESPVPPPQHKRPRCVPQYKGLPNSGEKRDNK